MSITLVTHKLDNDTGGARYANELRQHIQYDQIISISNKSNSAIDFFISIPLKVLLSEKTDIYHIAFNPCGLASIPAKLFGKRVILTIHDINPIIENPYHPIRIPNQIAVWLADKIITDAEMVKHDVIKILNANPDKITAIPLGISKKFKPMPKDNIFRIGYIGPFKKHKNVDFITRGTKDFGSVHLYNGGIPEEKLVETYNSFSVFVFPSIYEGFGFPILEAMRCGVPVIVLEGAHVPEEVTRYCFKVKTEQELSDCLKWIQETGYTETEEAVKYAESFKWSECAEKTRKALEGRADGR